MVELFSNFTTTLVIVGVILAIGIIFEKQLISLEDKFDAWWNANKEPIKANLKSKWAEFKANITAMLAEYKSNIKLRKETKNNAN